MQQIPVTILNGFLGAGKTTLMQSLLVQAQDRPDLRLGVVINEMSTLDVDGLILDTSEVISRRDPRFAAIPAGSISSPRGLAAFRTAIARIIADGAVTHILIETSGSAHPWPLIEAVRQTEGLQLHGFFAVVDTRMLVEDQDSGHAILPAASRNLSEGHREIENLLAEQIMFANKILLSRMDKVSEDQLRAVAEAIHPINPFADIMGMQWGSLSLQSVLDMPPYDHARVALLGRELDDWAAAHKTQDNQASTYDLETVEIEDPRPFHPQRLWDVYTQNLGRGIYRSKGFFWLPTRDRLQLLWNQSAGSVGLEVVNYWKAGVLADAPLLPEERDALREQLRSFSPEFGDRRCRLTVIGDRKALPVFVDSLKACFCTPEEISRWRAGGSFEDPWPVSTVHLEA